MEDNRTDVLSREELEQDNKQMIHAIEAAQSVESGQDPDLLVLEEGMPEAKTGVFTLPQEGKVDPQLQKDRQEAGSIGDMVEMQADRAIGEMGESTTQPDNQDKGLVVKSRKFD